MPKQELVNGPASKSNLTWDDIRTSPPGTLFQVVDDSGATMRALGDIVMITGLNNGMGLVCDEFNFWTLKEGPASSKLKYRKLDPSEKVVLSNE